MEVVHVELGASAVTRRESSECWGPVELAAELPSSHTVLGVGPLGRVEIPGSNRLVMAGWTPAWRGFYVSTLGSAGAAMRVCGFDTVAIKGRCESPSALLLGPGKAPRLIPISLRDAWQPGTHALLRHVAEKSGASTPRVLGIGPGSRSTTFGAVASSCVKDGELVLETWAGRGGFGTKWLAAHNLVAIVFDVPADAGYAERPAAGAVPANAELADALKKYRYHPQLKAGGTLGANLASLRDRMLAFNHLSMDWSRETREEVHARLVAGHYLAQHKHDTDGGKKGTDCGETCPAQCRRTVSGQKKDFQPFAALGPSIGIFDQRAAEEVYAVVEEWGVDAVDAGALAGFWMERLARGEAMPREAGSPGIPAFDAHDFDPVLDSRLNAKIAASILRRAFETHDAGAPLHLVDATAADPDRAVVVVNGAGGGVAPTQYWAPGVIAPTPIVGKYYTDYSLDYVPARELGRRCGERAIAEMSLDNLGLCRFQREWAEDGLDDLLRASGIRAEQSVDARHRLLGARIAKDAPVALWRGSRVRNLVATWVRDAAEDDPGNAELIRLRDAFARDARRAARTFYREIAAGVDDVWRGAGKARSEARERTAVPARAGG